MGIEGMDGLSLLFTAIASAGNWAILASAIFPTFADERVPSTFGYR